MIKLLSLAAALLTSCVLTENARAGTTGTPVFALSFNSLSCANSVVGSCEVPDPDGGIGPYPVSKTFTSLGNLTPFGFAMVYADGVSFGGLGTLDETIDSDLIEETIYNKTGRTFSAYTINLSSEETDTGSSPAVNGVGPLGFATFSSSVGNCNLMTTVSLSCSNLNVPSGGFFALSFRLGAPIATANYAFSLEQGPTVPEPATLALLGLGLAGLAASRRRKQ